MCNYKPSSSRLCENPRLPFVLVVVLVIVIENSRRTDYEDDDENEDECRGGRIRQPAVPYSLVRPVKLASSTTTVSRSPRTGRAS